MYTDEDIIDLYEDLLDIGLAQTPEEEAKEVYKILLDEFISVEEGPLPIERILRTLLDKNIPHSCITRIASVSSRYFSRASTSITVTTLPVVRGHVLTQAGICPIEVWRNKQQSYGHLVSDQIDLPDLRDHLFQIYRKYSRPIEDKYYFLLKK
jgi:hypothetical protein